MSLLLKLGYWRRKTRAVRGEKGEGRAAAAGGGWSELTCGSGTSACKTKVVVRV